METENALWKFSVKIYAHREVATACLFLQEEIGVNVNLIMFGLWLGNDGRLIKPDDADAAVRRVRAWHSEVVVHLRALRTLLKQGPFPAPCSSTNTLRTGIKRSELHAERIEQAVLFETAANFEQTEPVDALMASVRNVLLLLQCDESPFEDETRIRLALAEVIARTLSRPSISETEEAISQCLAPV